MGMIEDKLFIFCMFQFIKVDSKQIQATFTVCYYFWFKIMRCYGNVMGIVLWSNVEDLIYFLVTIKKKEFKY